MKHFGIYTGVLVVLAMPSVAIAEIGVFGNTLQTLIAIEDSSKMLETVSFLAMLTVAFATSAMVWISGRQMRGGVFGSVLNFFSIGMALVFVGLVVKATGLKGIDILYVKMVHDSFIIIGYILMGLAASRLLKVIKGE